MRKQQPGAESDPENLVVTGVLISSFCALIYLGLYAPFGASLWLHVLAAVPFLAAIPMVFSWAEKSKRMRAARLRSEQQKPQL